MKQDFQHIGIARICGWFGITRQAYYQNNWEVISTVIQEELVLQKVHEIRHEHPRMGARKLHGEMQSFLEEHDVKMGRDILFDLLSANHLLVKKRKRSVHTTNSFHYYRKYPNLIRDFVPTGINQLWVSDITYWKVGNNHIYISFVTDVYSHKIVGYQLAETLEAIESVRALKMALSVFKRTESNFQLIHHSDRGIQYCCKQYVKLLQDYNIGISMTENGDPRENAVAERVNGIIKDEYLHNYDVTSFKEAQELLKSVVGLYNNARPHMSIGNLKPNQVHNSIEPIKTKKLWKNYYEKKCNIVNQYQD
ncbi:MAG: IS3 family transposase [Bacteroidota bacterium]|jgi:transposase InsO family protein|nr:IS3 family transposase [Bacteroidota bacterium]